MLTIPQALCRLKANLADAVPESQVRQVCDDLGYTFRRRSLTPVVTTYLFLRQVLHGNPAVGTLRHRSGLDFTDAAYCQARARLPRAFFRRLQRAVTGNCRPEESPAARWRGHRLFRIDGSSFSMPDTPELQQAFGQPGAQAPGCGFPTAHLLVLFDAHAGFLLQALPAPLRTHDLSRAAAVHPELGPGDLLLGDRAFCSYAHLALLRRRNLHGCFRAHQKLLIDFRPHRRYVHPKGAGKEPAGLPRSRWLRRLGKHDQLVEYFKPPERPAWMTAAEYARLPASLVVREVRFRVREPGRRVRVVTLVTTLLDGRRYSARALAKLYAKRWQVEGTFKDVKEVEGAGQQQLRYGRANEGAFHWCLWGYTVVEWWWAWARPFGQLCDRWDSPWDDADRRPSHAHRRKALQRELLGGEFWQRWGEEPCRPEIRELVAALLDMAA